MKITRGQLREIIRDTLLREQSGNPGEGINKVIIKARSKFNKAYTEGDIDPDLDPGSYSVKVNIKLREKGTDKLGREIPTYPVEITSSNPDLADAFKELFDQLHVYATDPYLTGSSDRLTDDEAEAYRAALKAAGEKWTDYSISVPVDIIGGGETEHDESEF